jgi:hypothetical protein
VKADTEARSRIDLLADWVRRSVGDAPRAWFDDVLGALLRADDDPGLPRALALAPRKLGKADIAFGPDDLDRASALRPGFDPTGLTVDQAARISLLLGSHRGDDDGFARRLGDVYRTADLGEAIAYLRGLALFPASRELLPLAGDGARSAVKPIFEAVAHRNPYPAEWFDEGAWNQMVPKALFVGSSLAPIQGLAARANRHLAHVLVDYAHERWAAGRSVSPELWLCVGPFAEGAMIHDLERALTVGLHEERAAAAAALRASPSEDARAALARHAGS